MAKQTILIVEDDESIRRGMDDALHSEGYETIQAADGEGGLTAALQGGYDLLLLDLVLPGKDGLDILKQMRASHCTAPVIIMTARASEADRVKGLSLGADDYVVKPFSVRELLARVEAVLRRCPELPNEAEKVAFPGGHADLSRGQVHLDGTSTHKLTNIEARLLGYLAQHAGEVLSREEILARVWRINPSGQETRTVDMHIARLREKLGDNGAKAKVIVTVRGRGYMFENGEST
jgi:two-component system, OmpR family, alkaline phosphatase synthesis response regulator PhoP